MDEKKAGMEWSRCLHLEQPYADNHVYESFLRGLRRNVNIRHRTLEEVMLLSLPVSQQFSAVFMVFLIFGSLYNGIFCALPLFLMNGIFTTLGLSLWLSHRSKLSKFNIMKDISFFKEAFLISLILLALSPMLGSLAVPVSSEAIVTVIAPVLMLINMAFHDYSSISECIYRYPDSFSINAGISAAALLASRLKSNFQVLTLIHTAMTLLVLFPLLRRVLRKIYPRKSDIIITATLSLAFIMALAKDYPAIAIWHTLGVLVISVVAPLLFQYTKKYKKEYSGPWDEANVSN